MTTLRTYQEALDFIYSTFMRVKDSVKGLYDRDIRAPGRIVSLAEQLDIVPDPSRIVRITGSKGKGTTSRAAAAYLCSTLAAERVALFVSPEEIEHTDRIRLNGEPISQEAFVRIVNELLPRLMRIENALGPNEYISPFGLFLLIGLKWFKEMDARYFVLETGRGVRFDEVGNLRSKVGVVTSILLEHADKLGPGLEDIAKDKLSIAANSEVLVVPPAVHEVIRGFPSISLGPYTVVPPREPNRLRELPDWLETDLQLACAAVAELLEQPVRRFDDAVENEISAAFMKGSVRGIPFALEALISLDSMDTELVESWIRRYRRILVLASFPDDKDRERIVEHLVARGASIVEVVLLGTRGYLNYTRTAADSRFPKLTCMFNDVPAFAAALAQTLDQHRPPFVYLAGTQTFMRLARQALAELRRAD
jgi:dihydrofolate synthase/folylpolyglutamate synthase